MTSIDEKQSLINMGLWHNRQQHQYEIKKIR